MDTHKINKHLILDDYKSNIYKIIKFFDENKNFDIHLSYTDFVNRLFNDYQYIINHELDKILNDCILSDYIIGQHYIYKDEINEFNVTFLGCLFINLETNLFKNLIFNNVLCIFALNNVPNNKYILLDLAQCKRNIIK